MCKYIIAMLNAFQKKKEKKTVKMNVNMRISVTLCLSLFCVLRSVS